MIEAKDLRIGNIVTDEFYEHFKTEYIVESINDKGINLYIEDDGNFAELAQTWIAPNCPFDKLCGIPLTEEWLVKFGFSATSTHATHPTLDYNYDLWHENGKWTLQYLYGDHHGIQIGLGLEYVHQLQNLYFALAGTELEIK